MQVQKLHHILNLLSNPAFRLGGGSSKGFGKFKIIEIKTRLVDLANYSSSLNNLNGEKYQPKSPNANYVAYVLKIKPDALAGPSRRKAVFRVWPALW